MLRFCRLWCAAAALLSAQKLPFDAAAMMKLARVSDPQVSPDGRYVAFTVQTVDIEANKRPKNIYVVPLSGGAPQKITGAGDNNERARWLPDSKRLAYVSNRGGSNQIWLMDPDGANQKQVTDLGTETGGVVLSSDGKTMLFTSEVFPECPDDPCNRKMLDALKNDKVKARIYSGLLYRHWNNWQARTRSHLFAVPLEGGVPRDLTPGTRDVPPFSLGGPDDYAISPDGKEVVYSMNADEVPAISTNSDVFAVSVSGGASKRITNNPGADSGPQYSPDGKYIAYRSQARAGYESDRWRLMLLERATGKVTVLTDTLDRWVTGFAWAPDSSRLFFTAEDRGRQSIQFIGVGGGPIRVAVSGDSTLDEIQFTRDGKTMVYTVQSGSQPAKIFTASSSGGPAVEISRLNDAVMAQYATAPLDEIWVEGAEKARVQAFVVKPFGFDPARKYPVLMLIHGGPQGHWGETWSYRWNPQVFASAGYLVVMPNPRGSTGYGQRFIDEIGKDWGGRAYEDIMAVADFIAGLPYVDSNRMAAAGGSYGGYMVNWILGHTNRFKALVSHAGVYDLRSMFGETEELWFPLWEFGGAPWDEPETYVRWSPGMFAREFKTPTLVIHGELDYRVPYGQGLQLFTALQLRKVPSKLLLFPDEGHWILKPQNSLLWYKTFIEWIDTWTKK